VPVAEHQFGIVVDERRWPTVLAFDTNGLLDPVGGGALIWTGIASGLVRVEVEARTGAPPEVPVDAWDEIAEITLVFAEPEPRDDPLARFDSAPLPPDRRSESPR